MTKEEYKTALDLLAIEHKKQLEIVHKEYATSNASHKIGDIVSDTLGPIRVEKTWVYLGLGEFPDMVYYGTELTKKLEPTKRGNKRSVYQSNIKI